MPPSSRRKLFRISPADQIRSAWQRLTWPTPGGGESDDAARGLGFFRSYGTRVTNVSEAWPDGQTFRDHGQSKLSTRIRSLGQFTIPSLTVSASQLATRSRGIRGQLIASANPDRLALHFRLFGPINALLFLSGNEFVTVQDFQIDFGQQHDTVYITQSLVFAATNRTGVTLFVAEEERVET